MNWRHSFFVRGSTARLVALCAMLFILAAAPANLRADAAHVDPVQRTQPPFHPGEKLTYNISWSDIISAGTAVMEVRREEGTGEDPVLRFISTARSIGIVNTFYTVRDVIQSRYDPRNAHSLSYELNQRHGKRKKRRELVFDHVQQKVLYTSDGAKQTIDIQGHTQDALSSLYYLRTREDFTVGKTIVIGIHDSGKNWDVEVHVLGREKVTTPVGEFSTIKVKTYPKYEGVFMHKGEIYMWLTDDSRRIPVLMKSTITIGSIVATLKEIKLGDESQ
jgi:hypothetical protein